MSEITRRDMLKTAAALPLTAAIPAQTHAQHQITAPLGAFAPKNGEHPVLGPTGVQHILQRPGTHAEWSFTTAIGDTIKEKYETLTTHVCELRNVVEAKIRHYKVTFDTRRNTPHFWLLLGPELASVFETATNGFNPATPEEYKALEQFNLWPVGHYYDNDRRLGYVTLIKCDNNNGLPHDTMILGYDPEGDIPRKLHDPRCYATMKVHDFLLGDVIEVAEGEAVVAKFRSDTQGEIDAQTIADKLIPVRQAKFRHNKWTR